MLAYAKAVVALKEEIREAAKESHCTMRFEPCGTVEDQLESLGENDSAGFEDIEASLADIVRGMRQTVTAESVLTLPDEHPSLKDYEAAVAAARRRRCCDWQCHLRLRPLPAANVNNQVGKCALLVCVCVFVCECRDCCL